MSLIIERDQFNQGTSLPPRQRIGVMLVKTHEHYWLFSPYLLILMKDFHVPLMKGGLRMRLILGEGTHQSLAQDAVIGAPSVLLAEVDILVMLFFLKRQRGCLKLLDFITDFFYSKFGHQ